MTATSPLCRHNAHRYVIMPASDEPAVYDGPDRAQAVTELAAIRENLRADPDTHRIGLAVVTALHAEPVIPCAAEQEAVRWEVRRRVPWTLPTCQGPAYLLDGPDGMINGVDG